MTNHDVSGAERWDQAHALGYREGVLAERESVKKLRESLSNLSAETERADENFTAFERVKAKLSNIAVLHQESFEGEIAWCSECQTNYPCRTVRVLQSNIGRETASGEGMTDAAFSAFSRLYAPLRLRPGEEDSVVHHCEETDFMLEFLYEALGAAADDVWKMGVDAWQVQCDNSITASSSRTEGST